MYSQLLIYYLWIQDGDSLFIVLDFSQGVVLSCKSSQKVKKVIYFLQIVSKIYIFEVKCIVFVYEKQESKVKGEEEEDKGCC